MRCDAATLPSGMDNVCTMAIADYQHFMLPVLKVLQDGKPRTRSAIRSLVAEAEGVTPDEQELLLPSGGSTIFANRVGWAIQYLHKAAALDRPQRAQYQINARGLALLSEHSGGVDTKVLEGFAEFIAFKTTKKNHAQVESSFESTLSPTDRAEDAIAELNDAVAQDLLDRVLAMDFTSFERLTLKLLKEMGYGGREALLEHTGKPGDGGLDGIIRQDALGLDLVGVQAKHFDKDRSVERPDLQRFVGALQGAQTKRGIFVTTGKFSKGAIEYARGVDTSLVLIDGQELTRLMVRYNVGVSVRQVYEVKAIDEDFFDE
jgi:restriction system protein